MRPDQLQRLQELSEELADVFIHEADPENWSGSGIIPRDMTKEERGNRAWDKRGAMGTGGVLRYTLDLIGFHEKTPFGTLPAEQAARDADLDAKISDAEKRAAAAVERVMSRAKGAKVARG